MFKHDGADTGTYERASGKWEDGRLVIYHDRDPKTVLIVDHTDQFRFVPMEYDGVSVQRAWEAVFARK